MTQSDSTDTVDDYLPARMVNEFSYCPRLFYLMQIEGQFADSYDTIDGRIVHRRVDGGSGALAAVIESTIPQADRPLEPEPPAPEPPKRRRRVAHGQPATLFGDDDDADKNEDADQTSSSNESPDRKTSDDRPRTIHARSVTLSCDTLGVIAKLDLAEATGDVVTPVDYKRGRPKTNPDGQLDAWPPEKIQIALQALVLRANGYTCDQGVLYFNETRQRVTIPIDDALIEQTQRAVAGARELVAQPVIPPPLIDSPKCPRCSLVNICLPEETRRYLGSSGSPSVDVDGESDSAAIRPIITTRDDRRPLYLNHQGLYVGKRDEVLIAKVDGKVVQEVRLREINQLNLFGNVQLSTQAIQTLLNLQIPIGYYTQGGWFYGMTHSLGVKNILVRREQFRRADDAAFSLQLARLWVRSKIRNSRTLLMRNHVEPPAEARRELKRLAERALGADSPATLLGLEGTAARIYFSHFAGMLKIDCGVETAPGAALTQKRPAFDFRGRNRRPPRDPVNALLSLAYTLLTKDCMIAATSVGLDPYLGFYHQVKPGKPALALDLMEPFRPLIAESVVLSAINNRMVTPEHFMAAGRSVVLSSTGRKHFLNAYEQRLDALVTHPVFGYRVSYRRLLEIQTRLLARYLTGEIDQYPMFETR